MNGDPNPRHKLQIAEIVAAGLTQDNERGRMKAYIVREPWGTNPFLARPTEAQQPASDAGLATTPRFEQAQLVPEPLFPKAHSPRVVNQYQQLRDIGAGPPPTPEGPSPSPQSPSVAPPLVQDRQQRMVSRYEALRNDQAAPVRQETEGNASDQQPAHLREAEAKKVTEQEALKGGKPLTSEQRANSSTPTKESLDRKDSEAQKQVPEQVDSQRSRRRIDFSNFGNDRGGRGR